MVEFSDLFDTEDDVFQKKAKVGPPYAPHSPPLAPPALPRPQDAAS